MTLEEAAHGLTFTGDHKEDIVNDCNFITHIISEICAYANNRIRARRYTKNHEREYISALRNKHI